VADAPHGLAARVKIVITQPVNGPLMTSLLPTNGVSAIAPVAYGRNVHERCRVRRRWLVALGEIQNQPGGALDLPIGGLVDAWFSQQGV